MIKRTIAQAKRRQRIIMFLNFVFFNFVMWLVYDLAWYWAVLPATYVTLNLIGGMSEYARVMRVLNNPYAGIYESLNAIKQACDEAHAQMPDPIYDDNDRCRKCTRLRKRPHLEHCVHNEFWK